MKTIQEVKQDNWLISVEALPYVGSATKKALQKLEINTIKDLLFHFPFKYLDTSKVAQIYEVNSGEIATVVGEVKKVAKKMFGRRKSLIEVVIGDGTGYISAIFFNQPFMEKNFKEGDNVALAGKVEYKYGKFQINSPLYDKLDRKKNVNTMGIIPIYSATADVSTKKIRSLVSSAVGLIPREEMLPQNTLKNNNLISFYEALINVHFPKNSVLLKKARKRLIFQEFFELQMAILLKKQNINEKETVSFDCDGLISEALKLLPFELTEGQNKALCEIKADISLNKPMNRLLQGEVGSGKTIVSFLATLPVIESGYQAAIMAPTEILARQHHIKLSQIATKLNIKTELLVSSLKETEKEEALKRIENSEAKLIIGTHAVIQENIEFNNLGLVVVDEQHRFGVEQRKALSSKGIMPHTLVMSATPIPRSLALTLYGDLDVSTIKELPSGKNFTDKVNTLVCGPKKREQAYEKIRREVENGRQAYIICPLIDPSDKIEARAVEEEIKHLQNDIFPELKVASIHGKLKPKEKEQIMNSFSGGEIDVLLATTLIEVGIDVPNATVMVIENADRFGLAQLHQLRGRIGRGEYDAVCVLFSDLKTDDAIKRMKAIRELKDGFSLAEADLKIRGEGKIFGLDQAGFSDLKIARLLHDFDILKCARDEAKKLLTSDPQLTEHEKLKNHVNDKFFRLIELSGG